MLQMVKKVLSRFCCILLISLINSATLYAADSEIVESGSKQIETSNNIVSASAATEATQKTTRAKPHNKEMSGQYLVQLVLGLFVVLICIVVLAWFAKRMNRFQSSTQGALSIIGGLSMGSRERIVLLQAGDKQLLIGVAPGCVNKLHVFDEPVTEQSGSSFNQGGTSIDNSFSSKLAAMLAGQTSPAKKSSSSENNRGEDK